MEANGLWHFTSETPNSSIQMRKSRNCLAWNRVKVSVLWLSAEPAVAPRLGPHSCFARHNALVAAPAGELKRSAKEGFGMSWGVVGFLASLVPWTIALLSATGFICVPCWGTDAALLKGLWCGGSVAAVLASAAGLRRRAFDAWAVGGLAVGLVGGARTARCEPASAGAAGAAAAAVARA